MNAELLILIISGALSAVITFILNVKFKQGHVRASALVGVVVGCFVLLFPNLFSQYLNHNLPLVCFGASFVGMVSHKVLGNYYLLALSGGIFTILFLNISSMFNGFGGGLGATACVALLITLAIPVIFKKRKS